MSVYKGDKLVAGGSVDTHFVRRPAWNQAIAISAAELAAGYEAPADGMIVGSVIPSPGVNSLKLFCNGTLLSLGTYNINDRWSSYIHSHTIVNAGDVISTTPNTINSFSSELSFVPFEDFTVSDVEVVTPEYIRNQNILSDLESITISTSRSSPTVMPYDGVIYVSYKNSGNTPGMYYLNGQRVLWFGGEYGTAGNSGTLTVKKGDTVYVEFADASPSAFARYYKLRDYTGR